MATLDDVVNQSFLEELNRFNKKKIKTGECNNVSKLFEEVQAIKTDCNICYDDSIECIQCYQCDFKYCQVCLNKVISEFTKCSACSANFKDNYTQLKDKNKKKPARVLKSKNKPVFGNEPALDNTNEDLLLSDYEIEQLAILWRMDNIHIKPVNKNSKNSRGSTHTKNSKKINNVNNVNNISTNANQSYNDNPSYNDNQYLDNDFDDEIDPCQFQIINQSIYHFIVQQNKDCSELIYISSDDNLSPIILNYKLLDKCFQRTVYICLLEIRDNPDIFPNVWQTMSNMIYNFTCNYIHLIHTKNFKNQAYLYQKQDLVNTISQMASYN